MYTNYKHFNFDLSKYVENVYALVDCSLPEKKLPIRVAQNKLNNVHVDLCLVCLPIQSGLQTLKEKKVNYLKQRFILP